MGGCGRGRRAGGAGPRTACRTGGRKCWAGPPPPHTGAARPQHHPGKLTQIK